MRRTVSLCLIAVFVGMASIGCAEAQTSSFRGTVVHMEMSQCTQEHGFLSAMSGEKVVTFRICPEYTVVTERVVYVLAGLKTNQFMPLAENVTFFVNDARATVIVEDGKKRSHFMVRRMMLRSDWERLEHNRKLSPCSSVEPDTIPGVLVQTAER